MTAAAARTAHHGQTKMVGAAYTATVSRMGLPKGSVCRESVGDIMPYTQLSCK
jgi:hypothetical protein